MKILVSETQAKDGWRWGLENNDGLVIAMGHLQSNKEDAMESAQRFACLVRYSESIEIHLRDSSLVEKIPLRKGVEK